MVTDGGGARVHTDSSCGEEDHAVRHGCGTNQEIRSCRLSGPQYQVCVCLVGSLDYSASRGGLGLDAIMCSSFFLALPLLLFFTLNPWMVHLFAVGTSETCSVPVVVTSSVFNGKPVSRIQMTQAAPECTLASVHSFIHSFVHSPLPPVAAESMR